MSALKSDGCSSTTSGAMNANVPERPIIISFVPMRLAIPRSPIFTIKVSDVLYTKIFVNLRSRWIRPTRCMSDRPFAICTKMLRAPSSFSHSLPYCRKQYYTRSPSSASLVTSLTWPSTTNFSTSLTTKGLSLQSSIASASEILCTCCRLLYFPTSIVLMATREFVDLHLLTITGLLQPWSTFLKASYWSL